jgi:hypothetical protein
MKTHCLFIFLFLLTAFGKVHAQDFPFPNLEDSITITLHWQPKEGEEPLLDTRRHAGNRLHPKKWIMPLKKLKENVYEAKFLAIYPFEAALKTQHRRVITNAYLVPGQDIIIKVAEDKTTTYEGERDAPLLSDFVHRRWRENYRLPTLDFGIQFSDSAKRAEVWRNVWAFQEKNFKQAHYPDWFVDAQRYEVHRIAMFTDYYDHAVPDSVQKKYIATPENPYSQLGLHFNIGIHTDIGIELGYPFACALPKELRSQIKPMSCEEAEKKAMEITEYFIENWYPKMPKLHGEVQLVLLLPNLLTETDMLPCTESHKTVAEKIRPHLTHPELKESLEGWLGELEKMAKR